MGNDSFIITFHVRDFVTKYENVMKSMKSIHIWAFLSFDCGSNSLMSSYKPQQRINEVENFPIKTVDNSSVLLCI